jgi:hypothetical protein
LPGVEPSLIRFTEDWPNPLYRRICYPGLSEVIAALLNITGLLMAIVTEPGGCVSLRCRISPLSSPCGCSARSVNFRVKASTQNEGHERRYFYGSVWAVTIAQPALWVLWKLLPRSTTADMFKLMVFVGILAYVGNMARRGLLPRTRPIVPGELAISD